jgi:hypothetical protein
VTLVKMGGVGLARTATRWSGSAAGPGEWRVAPVGFQGVDGDVGEDRVGEDVEFESAHEELGWGLGGGELVDAAEKRGDGGRFVATKIEKIGAEHSRTLKGMIRKKSCG